MENLIRAIREDTKVGRGTCSMIDECMDDKDLIRELTEGEVKTPEAALKWAYEMEGLYWEQGLNQRWGEDDDEQLLMYNEWQEKLNES